METILRYFKGSLAVTAIGLILALWIGGPAAMFIALILAVLEISLSFDNAIVNAKVLETMDEKWRHRFLTWGMLIAVFGMRIVFPIGIVSIVADLTPWHALDMALNKPTEYAAALTSAHISIAGFGGAFLMMVFLHFFLDHEKDEHWIHVLESKLPTLHLNGFGPLIVTALAVLGVSDLIPDHESMTFIYAAGAGMLTYQAVHWLGELFDGKGMEATANAGLASFIYLEILDASFSFDGVIGAFALTKNFLIIAIGLGIGAMFVRSLTIYFVEKKTLATFKYLEHGAFWAIGSLALIMFIGTVHHIPEVVTGLIGGFLIVASLYSSLTAKKLEA